MIVVIYSNFLPSSLCQGNRGQNINSISHHSYYQSEAELEDGIAMEIDCKRELNWDDHVGSWEFRDRAGADVHL